MLKPQLSTPEIEALLAKASPGPWSTDDRPLEDLLDEQNGPPLIRHEEQWRAAVDALGRKVRE